MTQLFKFWPNLVALAQALAVCMVLCGSLGYQFLMGEMPCPLCVVQRAAFLLALVGPIGILARKTEGLERITADARDFGLTIFAGLIGLVFSVRQVLLHIVPPDPGYGPPVLGLHLYTWAAIVFFCLILGSGIGILGLRRDVSHLPPALVKTLCSFVILLACVFAAVTFAMEGFNWLLPDDPVRYELFNSSTE